MNHNERIALHRKLVDGMIDGYTHCVERQRVVLPEEFVVSEDAVLWAPMMYGTKQHRYGDELGDSTRTPSERATAEMRSYWRELPDFRMVAHAEPIVSELGFSLWLRLEGSTSDGRRLGFYEVDLIRTNERGEISRIESFHDTQGLAAVLELLGVGEDLGWEGIRRLRTAQAG